MDRGSEMKTQIRVQVSSTRYYDSWTGRSHVPQSTTRNQAWAGDRAHHRSGSLHDGEGNGRRDRRPSAPRGVRNLLISTESPVAGPADRQQGNGHRSREHDNIGRGPTVAPARLSAGGAKLRVRQDSRRRISYLR